ncbi:uncharacterized protein LTR77_008942 [Saxophila tyrrhenica]|uniref:Heterokaryon incompatibility domain-containing protein n=1 Tax=Saxophila tyrrhenica TaxID=1690608 RepID=A0AAV9NZ86_9PEZI|nr:hypothetical protein LTR77_008942 [Saxophila tyrrhenica]
MLCQPCVAVLDEPKYSDLASTYVRSYLPNNLYKDLQPLHEDFHSLRTSLASGCGLCHRFVDALVNDGKSKIITPALEWCDGVEADRASVGVRLSHEHESQRVIGCMAVFKAWKGDQEKLLSELPAPSANNDVDSSSIDVIRSWVKNCETTHDACRKNHETISGRRFARILDVGTDIRLCSGVDLPADIRYTTLSHCWGQSQDTIPSLTKEQYAAYFKRIAFSDLPQTFRDAVQLTRRLDVQYVWIDSLCIIQDSREDWLDQAAVMADIYQRSWLNIAATKASNPHGGLFTARNPVLIQPLRVPVRSKEKSGISGMPPWEDPFLKIDNNRIFISTCIRPPLQANLDSLLGNSNGSFRRGGVNFSFSARNVELHEYELRTELRDTHGQWNASKIDIRSLFVPSAEWESLELTMPATLRILFHSDTAESQQDLNSFLGNTNGQFDWSGSNFQYSARNVGMQNSMLLAELRALDGEWRKSFISLERLRSARSSGTRYLYDVGDDPYVDWSSEISHAKLMCRGWVVQERFLAPRVVDFAKRQLLWECSCSRDMEAKPEDSIESAHSTLHPIKAGFKSWDIFSDKVIEPLEPRDLGVNYVWSSIKALLDNDKVALVKSDLHDEPSAKEKAKSTCYGLDLWTPTHPLITFWSEIARMDSGCDLSFPTDRLVAISAIARLLHKRSGMRYVAGLWEH